MSQELGARRAKELGLVSWLSLGIGPGYSAGDIHKLLGNGKPLYENTSNSLDWCEHVHHAKANGLSGLLIGIHSIRPQTLEDLVREFLLNRENSHLYAIEVSVNAFCTKAREILEAVR